MIAARRFLTGLLACSALFPAPASGDGAPADTLAALGIRVTTGAAAGYVADGECRTCHIELFNSYQNVAMARSFRRATAANAPEARGARFVHTTSGQRFELNFVGEKLVFRRFVLGPEADHLPYFETEVSWIVGSGNHARVYLYQTPAGELYQLPISWYGQTNTWGMAPGFDRPDHEGVTRRVRRECMFCHNAYPEVPLGSDRYGEPPLFPAALPEGIGCQRCHGPGATHLAAAYADETTMAEVRAAIVNPGKLEPARRDDICLGCHLQPSVALPGLRRFERSDYSFRPGEALASYLVQVDIEEEGKSRGDRFEINHHPYRLHQSSCFKQSAGRMSCLTCHNPHRKVPAEQRSAHYRQACLSCHQSAERPFRHAAAGAQGDCTACHMPLHRPEDVVQVLMTDHLIRRTPPGQDWTAPRAESEPVITALHLTDGQAAPSGALGEIYRTLAVVRASRQREALDHLDRLLLQDPEGSAIPRFDLAEALLVSQRVERAAYWLERLVAGPFKPPQALAWLGLARFRLGDSTAARQHLEHALAHPGGAFQPETRFNLGLLYLSLDQPATALPHLEQAVAERPNLAAAWYYLGVTQRALGDTDAAGASFRRCLAIDPRHARARDQLRPQPPEDKSKR